MNRLRTISWASSLFMAAVVGCQLVGCSDDTTTPTGPEDSSADASPQPDTSTPDANMPDTSHPDAGVDTGVDAPPDVANDVMGDVMADVMGDVMGDVATDAHADGGEAGAGDAGGDAHVDAGDTGADVVVADVVVADVQGDHTVVGEGGMDAGDATVGEGGGGGDAMGDVTVVGDTGSGDVVVVDVSTADVDAGPTIQQLCDAFLAANVSAFAASGTTCTGTELALFAHDVVAVMTGDAGLGDAGTLADPNGNTCLGCAFQSGCVDTSTSATKRECEEHDFTASGTTLAQCIAELECGVGVPSTCTASSPMASCPTPTVASTSIQQTNGILVNNLYCGSLSAPTCNADMPAAEMGSCTATWVAGIPAADQTAAGSTVLGDGAQKANASGFANGILTCLDIGCQSNCWALQ